MEMNAGRIASITDLPVGEVEGLRSSGKAGRTGARQRSMRRAIPRRVCLAHACRWFLNFKIGSLFL
jgi:hypothetical protein